MRILFGYTPQRCLGTQASPPAFKEVRSIGRTIDVPIVSPASKASFAEAGRQKKKSIAPTHSARGNAFCRKLVNLTICEFITDLAPTFRDVPGFRMLIVKL